MDYVIPHKGLGLGTHQYQFKIDRSFFDDFEFFENETGQIDAEVTLIKESNLLDLQFELKGHIALTCDRCLGTFDREINGSYRLLVKFGEAFAEESAEVIIIPVTENTLDLRQYFFEYINLLLPLKRVHPNESDCDPEMIKKLQKQHEQDRDPRWDALKDLKLE